MFKWTVTFFVISMMAAILGFTTDIDPSMASIAKLVFFVFVGLMFLSAIIGAAIKRHREE